jgi:hypothetical protein
VWCVASVNDDMLLSLCSNACLLKDMMLSGVLYHPFYCDSNGKIGRIKTPLHNSLASRQINIMIIITYDDASGQIIARFINKQLTLCESYASCFRRVDCYESHKAVS